MRKTRRRGGVKPSNFNNPAHYGNNSRKVFNMCRMRKLANNPNATRICRNDYTKNSEKLVQLNRLIKKMPPKTWPYTGYSKGGSTRRRRRQ